MIDFIQTHEVRVGVGGQLLAQLSHKKAALVAGHQLFEDFRRGSMWPWPLRPALPPAKLGAQPGPPIQLVWVRRQVRSENLVRGFSRLTVAYVCYLFMEPLDCEAWLSPDSLDTRARAHESA